MYTRFGLVGTFFDSPGVDHALFEHHLFTTARSDECRKHCAGVDRRIHQGAIDDRL